MCGQPWRFNTELEPLGCASREDIDAIKTIPHTTEARLAHAVMTSISYWLLGTLGERTPADPPGLVLCPSEGCVSSTAEPLGGSLLFVVVFACRGGRLRFSLLGCPIPTLWLETPGFR